MLEIICIIWLWRVNGKHAMERGQKPGKYRALTLGLWFGLEFIGTFLGIELMQILAPSANPIYGAYVLGIIGAAIGGLTSYQLVKRAPMGNYRPEEDPNAYWNNQPNGFGQNQNGWNQNTDPWNGQQSNWNQSNWNQNIYEKQPDWGNGWEQKQQPDCLFAPATIRIIDQGTIEDDQDEFFLNGRPVCALRAGSEYTFTTYAKKNILTIGTPSTEQMNKFNTLKFIASENGQIEVCVLTHRFLPEAFKNYTS